MSQVVATLALTRPQWLDLIVTVAVYGDPAMRACPSEVELKNDENTLSALGWLRTSSSASQASAKSLGHFVSKWPFLQLPPELQQAVAEYVPWEMHQVCKDWRHGKLVSSFDVVHGTTGIPVDKLLGLSCVQEEMKAFQQALSQRASQATSDRMLYNLVCNLLHRRNDAMVDMLLQETNISSAPLPIVQWLLREVLFANNLYALLVLLQIGQDTRVWDLALHLPALVMGPLDPCRRQILDLLFDQHYLNVDDLVNVLGALDTLAQESTHVDTICYFVQRLVGGEPKPTKQIPQDRLAEMISHLTVYNYRLPLQDIRNKLGQVVVFDTPLINKVLETFYDAIIDAQDDPERTVHGSNSGWTRMDRLIRFKHLYGLYADDWERVADVLRRTEFLLLETDEDDDEDDQDEEDEEDEQDANDQDQTNTVPPHPPVANT